MAIVPAVRVCRKCGKEKTLSEYHRDRSNKDGHVTACKSCVAAYQGTHRDRLLQRGRERQKHPESVIHHHKVVLTRSLFERFLEKVAKTDTCWLWQGHRDRNGYGSMYVDPDRKRQLAHRISYELTYGVFSSELCVLHRCDNPSCVRPDHLFLGTVADNNADKKAKGREARGERHGTRTHPESFGIRERPKKPRIYPKVPIEQLIADYQSGLSTVAIARKYGIAQSGVHRRLVACGVCRKGGA